MGIFIGTYYILTSNTSLDASYCLFFQKKKGRKMSHLCIFMYGQKYIMITKIFRLATILTHNMFIDLKT